MAEAADPRREGAIVDKVVLEQVFQAVPIPVWAWLMRNGPTTLSHAATHLENCFLAEWAFRAELHAPEKSGGKGQRRGAMEKTSRGAKLAPPFFQGDPQAGGSTASWLQLSTPACYTQVTRNTLQQASFTTIALPGQSLKQAHFLEVSQVPSGLSWLLMAGVKQAWETVMYFPIWDFIF